MENSASAPVEDSLKYSGDILKLQDLIRLVAAQKLAEMSRSEAVASDLNILNRQVYNHWMGMILISGRNLKISYKIHFNSNTAFALLASRRGKPPEEFKIRQAFDFLKETCNTIGGGIKESLGSENSVTGLSLPIICRGFDHIFFLDNQKKAKKERNFDVWKIEIAKHQLICSSDLQVMDYSVLKNVGIPQREEEEIGDLEFL